jgi:uncharacterized OB-fold protein
VSRFHEILCLTRGSCKHGRRILQSIGFYFDTVFLGYTAPGCAGLERSGHVHQWHGRDAYGIAQARALRISFTPGQPWQALHCRAGLNMKPTEPAATSPSCASSSVLTQDDIRLVDVPARVASITADRLNFSPDPPFHFGLIQFENGARVMMEMVDTGRTTPAVGDAMRMRFRIKAADRKRGFRTYFWKAAPLARPHLEA